MSPVSILQCLLLLLASLLVYELISKAHTIMKYPSGTTGVLSFPNNAEVNVYSKEAGSNPDWWGVEINGKFGYAPKKFIREDKVLLKDDLLTHIVPVMSASMGLKKEIPIDPKILSKVNEVKNDENEDGGEEFDEEDELDGIQFYNKEDERQVKDEQKQDDLTEPSQASAPVNNVASVAQDSIGEKSPPESVLPSADISPVSISSPPVQISSDQPLSVKEISLPTNVEHTASSDPASILPSQVKYEVVDGTTLYVDSGDVTEPPIHLPSYQTPPPLPATTTHTAHVITPTPPLTPSLSQDTITVPPTAGEEPSRSQVLNTPELMMVSTGLPQSTIDKGEAPAAAGTPPIQPQKDHVSREEPPEHLKAVPIGSGSMSVTSSATDESKPDAASIPSNQNIDENYKQITNEGGIDNFQPSIVGIQREQAPNSIGNFSSDSESAIPITNAAMTSDFTAPKPDDVLNIPADNKPNETNEPKATENVVEISGNNQDQTESLSPEASGLDGSPETSVPKVSARASALEGSAQASAFEGSTEASAFEGAPESFALEVSPESLVLEGSGNEQKQASHSIPDGYPETLATVSESEDLELEVEPQDSDVKAENGGSFFGAFFSGWSSTEEQKHEDEDEVSTDAPSNSGDESSDNLVNSGATVEENSQNSVQETSFITTMVKEPPSATITKSLEASAGIAGMPGLASNTLDDLRQRKKKMVKKNIVHALKVSADRTLATKTKYGGDEAQEPAAHSGQDESSSAESGYSSDEEMNTSNPSTTHEPVAEGGTDSLSHDHQPGEGEADEPHSEDGNVESSLQPPTEASSETNPEYAHASLDGLQDEPNKSHISSDLEHAHSDESADTEAPEASDAKSPESPDLGSPESENESSVSSDANAEDPSDLHHPESLTGHLLKTVEPIIQWLSGSSQQLSLNPLERHHSLHHSPQLGESLSLALEHDLSAPVESRGSLMAMAIVAATILLLYVVHAAFTRSARESPLLEALNRLEHEQHTADGLIMQLKSQLTSSQVFNDGRAGKDKLTQLLDVVKARSDLTCAQQERRALEAELKESSEQLQKLQERLQQAQQEAEQCRKEKMQAQLEQKEALNKLTVLTDYFQEEKAQLTKELESESGLRHTAEGSAESVSSRIRNYDMQLMAYKAQVEMLKKELEDQEVSYRTQLAAQEQKAHESWVAARAAERKYDESKQETAQLRSRLLLMSKENSEQLPIAKPLPKHAEASNGSLSSPRPPLHDDLDGEHSLPLDSPPPIPPPPHLLPHLFPPPPHLFPPPPHLPGMPPPPFLPPSHFLPPPPMLDRRLPPAGRLASPPFHRRIEAASPPFHRRIGAASPPELLDRHSPPIFDRRSFSPASERSRYSDRQYSPDRHSRYSPDKIGRYSPDRQGRYSPDRQDQFSPDRSGRYSPDRPGRYFPDRLYDRHHPDRYNNSDRHSDAYSSNGRNSSPDGVAKRTSPTPPQRRPYDNGGQLGKGKKTSTPLGPNDR
ncbi:hypothetical protein HAZT_HAZT001636 [Hyalella azteca]|uniref:SH3 domain-containing protein n=1 Tax=Hyalella azteca TaxID=294128 RepID=A0A6A0GUS9_HYAAZ|nr:hypothetical protein HAZT_HAZT001636 [Hyalella azteca]